MKNRLLLSSVLVMASIGMLSDVYAKTTVVAKPKISDIAAEWDVEVGQKLSIPLSVTDPTQSAFQIIAKPLLPGATYSAEYTASNQLPTVDFQWTPAADKANKVYTVAFNAQETTGSKLKSPTITTKIRVWPAENRDQAYVHKLVVSTVNWGSNKLTLKGKVILSNMLSATEKTDFLKRTDFSANITQGSSGTGPEINASQPITFDSKGGFTLTDIALSAPPAFSCNLTVDFEGAKASRKIAGAPKGCIK